MSARLERLEEEPGTNALPLLHKPAAVDRVSAAGHHVHVEDEVASVACFVQAHQAVGGGADGAEQAVHYVDGVVERDHLGGSEAVGGGAHGAEQAVMHVDGVV